METSTRVRRRSATDKRAALLEAALRLFARDGLHSVPTSAISREAGVATGTLFVYFKSKEELIQTLYLDAIAGLAAATLEGMDANATLQEDHRRAWFNRARWHLANPAASNLIRQCEASSILTPEVVAAKAQIESEGSAHFESLLASGKVRPWPRQVHFALLEGPILTLVHLQDKGEIEISEEILEMTYQGVSKAMLA